MKSIIKSTSRTEKRAYIIFRLDTYLLKNIEKSFRKLNPQFKLLNFRKYSGEKWLSDFYESNNVNEDFNFTIVIKNNNLRLKIKANLNYINIFMENIMNFAEFAEYKKPKKTK